MADALSKLQPALSPKPPVAVSGGEAHAAQGAPGAPSGASVDDAHAAPELALGGVVLMLGLVLAVVAGWWRVRRPVRRLQRALQQWQHTGGAQHNPALAAQALQALARRHGCRPDGDWQAAMQRIMFTPTAPQAAWDELRQLAAQVPRMERRP